MSSPKSRRNSGSAAAEPEEELRVLRSQLEAGQIVMTRQMLLRVVDSLSPSWFGSGVDLFGYFDTEVDEATRTKYHMTEAFAHSQMVEDWCDAWYRCARPEWLDVMADILIDPPLAWTPDEEFTDLFLNVAGQFPDKAVQVLAVLFSDERVHPRLAILIKTLQAARFN